MMRSPKKLKIASSLKFSNNMDESEEMFSSKLYGSFISLIMNKVARYEDDYEGASKLMHSFMVGINDGLF